MKHSELISNSDYIIKITGRLFVKNFHDLISNIPKNHDIDIITDLERGLTWADSRVFFFSKEFAYKYLFPLQNKLNDTNGVYFEHIHQRPS